MPRLILTTACATAVLSLSACGYDSDEYNEANAAYNVEETNYADNMADYNDMNAVDYNETGNAMENAAGNASDDAAGNAATNNATGY